MTWRGWGRGWVWAAMAVAAMSTGAWVGTGAARAAAVDCWLLDGDRMEQAADRGLCDDAFSRNSKPGEPPALGPTASLPEPPLPPVPAVTPPRKPVPKAMVRARPPSGGPHASRRMAAHTAPSRSGGGDFFSNFRRDLGALGDLLGGGSSGGGRPADSGSSYPSHSGR